MSSGRSVHTSTRTITEQVRDASGQLKTVTKTIVTETTTEADGTQKVVTRENTVTGDRGMSEARGMNAVKTKEEKKKKPQKHSDFVKEVIKAHNKYRKIHGKVGDLKHDKDLDVLAQRWADHLSSEQAMKNSNDTYKGEAVGENIATRWGTNGADYDGAEVCEQWYTEHYKHDYATVGHSHGSGHFSQMVWKGTQRIGVGKSFNFDGTRVYIVCHYFPAGNVRSAYAENVFPPSKK